MSGRRAGLLVAAVAGVVIVRHAGVAQAQTAVNGASLALRSSGTASGASAWTLSSDGYLGTYVTLASAGPLTLTVNAAGSTSNGIPADMTVSVADYAQSFTVGSGSAAAFTFATPTLPAGTYFVRTQLDNHDTTFVNGNPVAADTALTVNSLSVGGAGAGVANVDSNANALAAADTYAANFRRGAATVHLVGAPLGASVEFKLRRNAFDFEGSVTGSNSFDPASYMAVANPTPGSTAYNYQTFYNANFNTLEPSNAGKWANNEPAQGRVSMAYVDTLLNYAQTHDLNVRMHNLIWGNQQPAWVNTLLTNAQSGNPATAAAAKASLSAAISNRIAYYVGANGNRADEYQELDVLNEALRTAPYWSIFGASGIANIYHQAAVAAAAAGNPSLRLYTNEFNVVQFSTDPATGAQDPYANWYRQNVQDIRGAVDGPSVSGIGVQYYADSSLANHSAARIEEAFQNLSVTGLPISLTEFNVKNGATPATAAQILTETMRMLYGTPGAANFGLWDFWAGAASGGFTAAALYDANWNLTPVGAAYQALLAQWSTDVTTTVGAEGTANFFGTFGDYDVIVNGQPYPMTLEKGTTDYVVVVPEPGAAAVMLMGFAVSGRRRGRIKRKTS